MRVVVPNPSVSIRHYLDGDDQFPLFGRRRAKARQEFGIDDTLFECLSGASLR